MTTAGAKTVLITGANRGIGLAFASHYAGRGWKVIASARNLNTADEVRIVSILVMLSQAVAIWARNSIDAFTSHGCSGPLSTIQY